MKPQFSPDGVHLNSAGYAAIEALARGAIERALAQRSPQSADASIRLQAVVVPYSSLASEAAKKNFLELARLYFCMTEDKELMRDIEAWRKRLDDEVLRPGVENLRRYFPVRIRSESMGGVRVDVIEPEGGVAEKNERRVLINLHGGGFIDGAGLGGQMESIPIASTGAIRVIAIDYRQAPEHRFPAASEDVEAVYRALLAQNVPANNIGIYGSSAGGMLTAQAVARFQTNNLPAPGAIGIFGAGALVPMRGDSLTTGSLLGGLSDVLTEPKTQEEAKRATGYFDVPHLDLQDPLVSPVYSPSVLQYFPPTLIISGTRDFALSAAVYTHAQLIRQHVDADLHVWEGASHCPFAAPIADPNVPETREAWDVIVNFFVKHLGH